MKIKKKNKKVLNKLSYPEWKDLGLSTIFVLVAATVLATVTSLDTAIVTEICNFFID